MRFKIFADGGILTPTDINNLRSEIDGAVTIWRTICVGAAYSYVRGSSGHFLAPGELVLLGSKFAGAIESGGVWSTNPPVGGTPTPPIPQQQSWLLYLDPQNYGARRGRLRWRVQLAPNNVAYGANLTFALYAATAFAHGEQLGQGWPQVFGQLSAVAGSAFTVVSPPPSSLGSLSFSNSVVMPSAGYYVMGVSVNVAPAPTSDMTIRADLQFRAEKTT